ncbi:MAG: Glutamyl-tRNA synthetase, class Ic [Bacteroidota bacterium]|nr:Glutamyl-tRNA synthetase, class Ic [Bacteroidota bacterium]
MVRSRIAPTPSGYLHIGNAINFVITWLWVRKQKGSLRLRIDDLDTLRKKPEYVDDIFRTLDWLGLDWDEGPQSPDEQKRQFSQLRRTEVYNDFIKETVEKGKVFACTCARSEIQLHSHEGQYPGTCRNKGLPLHQPETALRILVPENSVVIINDIAQGEVKVDVHKVMRDFVIRRRDGIPAYQIASLKDDLDFNINYIVRGEDLLYSTAAQIFLANLYGQNDFGKTSFYHHSLLKDEQGHKLSKSAGSVSLKAWREQGRKAEEFYLTLSKMLGEKQAFTSLNEMLQLANLDFPLLINT